MKAKNWFQIKNFQDVSICVTLKYNLAKMFYPRIPLKVEIAEEVPPNRAEMLQLNTFISENESTNMVYYPCYRIHFHSYILICYLPCFYRSRSVKSVWNWIRAHLVASESKNSKLPTNPRNNKKERCVR